ncbi:hypothetical protein Pfo_019864 [Paulownia fortunei]|nr:hypothetical protein Pfo_019864 [Paulownia fortunei]
MRPHDCISSKLAPEFDPTDSVLYTRRATLVSSNSLELLLKVWRTRSTKSLNSVEVLHFFRNLGTATQRADFYNTFDHSIAETSDYNSDSLNNRFCGRNLGGVEQNQNHNAVYGQYGNFSAERKDFYNGDSNQNNWFLGRTLGGVEQNRNSNGASGQNLDGQYGNCASGYVGNALHSEVQKNVNFNGCGNRGLLGTTPQFQHDWSGHCDSGGNYAGNPEMS